MQVHRLLLGALLTGILVFVGCGKKESSPPLSKPDTLANSEPAAPAPNALEGWQGTWFGPEGTYLKLTAKPDSKFEVVIRDLDVERSFEGVAEGDQIRFTRQGVQETIRATDGDATGMKWLAGKSNCLTVKQSEGYCRD